MSEIFAELRNCAVDLEGELRQLAQHLEDVRANVEQMRERLTTCLRQLDEPSGEDTIRLLRAALEIVSQQRNGGSHP